MGITENTTKSVFSEMIYSLEYTLFLHGVGMAKTLQAIRLNRYRINSISDQFPEVDIEAFQEDCNRVHGCKSHEPFCILLKFN